MNGNTKSIPLLFPTTYCECPFSQGYLRLQLKYHLSMLG